MLDPASGEKVLLPVCGSGVWSPTGEHLWLRGVGVVTPDGEVVVDYKKESDRAYWSPDGSRVLLYNGVLDVPSGRFTPLTPPAERAYPLGWAEDGQSVFFGLTKTEM